MGNEGNAEQQATGQMPDMSAVFEALDNLAAKASTKSAFGEPVSAAGRTVIPVADVVSVLGFGMGQGTGGPEVGTGGGAGAGGVARSRPLGTVVIDDQGVRILPIVDISRLALAGMATGGFILIWMVRLLKGDGISAVAKGKSLPTPRAMRHLVGRVN